MATLSIRRTRARRGPLGPFLFLCAVSLALLLLRDTDVMRGASALGTAAIVPIQRAMADTGSAVGRFTTAIGEIERLGRDNAHLRAENDRLTLENVRLREQLVAAGATARVEALAASLPYDSVPSTVIARDPGVLRSLVVGVGSEAGVAVGHVVLSEQGVVGRVTEVGPGFAKVLLVTDASSVVSALVQDSRATGIVRGQFGESLLMEWVLATEPMKVGDVVLTAGLGLDSEVRSHYPKGLVLGRVVEVAKADNSAYLRAVLLPAVDLRKLEHVLVVKTP